MPTKNRRHTKKETNETLADVEQKQHLVANFVSVCLMYVPILSRKIWFGSLNFELNSLAQTEFYQQNNKIAIFFSPKFAIYSNLLGLDYHTKTNGQTHQMEMESVLYPVCFAVCAFTLTIKKTVFCIFSVLH